MLYSNLMPRRSKIQPQYKGSGFEAYDSAQAVKDDNSRLSTIIRMIFDDLFPKHNTITGTHRTAPGHTKTYTLTRGSVQGISVVAESHNELGFGLRLNLQPDGDWEAEVFKTRVGETEKIISPGKIIDLENSNLLRDLQEDLLEMAAESTWKPIDELLPTII